MHITWELVDHLLKPTENVHLWAHDAGRVTVASTRQIASHVRRLPLASLRVEAEQNITNLYKADFNWEHCIMRIVDSPSRRFGRRKCTLCFRMHKPYVLWSTFFGEKRKSKSLKWNWKFFSFGLRKILFSAYQASNEWRKYHLVLLKLTVSLKRNVRILFLLHRQLMPSHCFRVEHMDVHRSREPVVLTGTVSAERVDEVADGDARMVDATWT